jgi:hypothetical protein
MPCEHPYQKTIMGILSISLKHGGNIDTSNQRLPDLVEGKSAGRSPMPCDIYAYYTRLRPYQLLSKRTPADGVLRWSVVSAPKHHN